MKRLPRVRRRLRRLASLVGALQSGALEGSNVEITSQLVHVIVAQRLPGERSDDSNRRRGRSDGD